MTLSPEELARISADQERVNREQMRLSAEENADRIVELSRRLQRNVAADDMGEGSPPTMLPFQTLNEFVRRPTASAHVASVIPAHSLVVVFGPTKCGKTFAVMDLAMHAAHGLDWHGFKIRRRLRVAYLCGEGTNGFRVRLHAWLQRHDSTSEPGDFRILPRALSLPARINEVIDALTAFAPDVVVTDTLNAYFGAGNENDTQDMTTFVGSVRLLIQELGCAVVVIHHTGLGDPSRERGSTVLRSAADVVAQVGRDERGSGLVGFQVITARDTEPMEEPLSLRLTRFATDWLDEDGEPMTTCIVEGTKQSVTLPGRGSRPLGRAQTKVLAAAHELARQATPDASGQVVLSRSDVAERLKGQKVSRQSLSSAWQSLDERGCLRLVDPGSFSLRVPR